jgi:predicted metalloprotease with PDZ domain
MKTFQQKFVLLALSLALFVSAAIAQNNIKLTLDASEAAKNIFRVKETINAPAAGKFALFYPKWIPGEHAPTGTINDMVNLFVTADGKPLTWQRDDVEMFAFYVDVPAGAKQLEVSFDCVSQENTIASANLARIKWNRLILYPRALKSDEIQVAASMKVPNDWKYATALPIEKESKDAVDFKAVNLTTFIDSPAIIGKYFAKIPLSNDSVLVEMDIAAETAEGLKYKPETLAGWKNLVTQANLMFGARHYNSYRFLNTFSDYGGSEGLEHHESSENGENENALSDRNLLLDLGELLGHEFVHSWNGKYRRPATLTTPDFEQPMHGELLWVYEGLTQYLGKVLPARSGLWTDEMFRESMASIAAEMDFQTGRRWRPLVDTSRAVQFTYPSPRMWMNERRRVDYYDEGALVWMEADVLIREKSGGRASLDDFLRKFHGGQNTGALVKTYDFEEIVRTLNEVLPYDWRAFFIDRVYKVQKNAPLGGFTNGGWQLVYNDTPNLQVEIDEQRGGGANLMYSIGILVSSEGAILDINPDLAAAKAGLAPGMAIREVNDEEFTLEDFQKAVADTKDHESSIKIEAANGSVSNTYTINYKGGAKYPHLVRDMSKTDYLSGISKPLSNVPAGFTVVNESHTGIFEIKPGMRRNKTSNLPRPTADVKNLILSQSEITANCPTNSNICSDSKRTIEISVEGFSSDPTDILTYNYTVSAGKLIGQGAKVVWDLTGVPPGTYTITAGVDNGCGVCGVTKTETVVIKECPNCK